jgi:hypothetical protein
MDIAEPRSKSWHPKGSLNHRTVEDTRGQPGGVPARCQERLEKNVARVELVQSQTVM